MPGNVAISRATVRPDNPRVPSPESSFRRRLREWYRLNGRHGLPWRLTRDPYVVLVSEVMLQQTQVERVLPYYVAWLKHWPDVASLAAASPAAVIRAWSGLGYNRRALSLHRAATIAASLPGGAIPIDIAPLRALPGVGPYTAAAVASFAGERAVPVADTNIGRVIARARLGLGTVREVPGACLDAEVSALLPASGPVARDHNLALMDLGALVCTARNPACGVCPLSGSCAWRLANYPASPKTAKPTPRFETTARFARGRIVEALRNAPTLSVDALASLLPPAHGARIEAYVAALARDGLISRNADNCSLAS